MKKLLPFILLLSFRLSAQITIPAVSVFNKIQQNTNRPGSKVSKKKDRSEYARIDSLNNTPYFMPLITAGLSGIESLGETGFGSAELGSIFRLSSYDTTSRGFPHAYLLYVAFGIRTANNYYDSSNAIKNIIFPELNKRDFVVGVYKQYLINRWDVSPTFEFSINSYKDSIQVNKFVSTGGVLGCRFKYQVNLSNSSNTNFTKSFVEIFPYFSIVDIDPKYKRSLQVITGEEKIRNTYTAFGMRISVQFDRATLYANGKYLLQQNSSSNQDLQHFVYTIGSRIGL